MTGVRCWPWVVAVLMAVTPPAPAQPTRGFQDRVSKGPDGQEVKYALFVPHGYSADKPPPVILFLHGAGETGTDGKRQTQVGLGPVVRGREKTFPFLVVFPQAQRREQNLVQTWWPGKKEGDRALAILAEVQKEYKTDPQRVYLTGISMGGFGTWALAQKYPDRWAAIAPVCGGGDPSQAGRIKDLPCWCFHGADDPVVPAQLSRSMVEALQKAGGHPKYTEYPGVQHESWKPAYATDELYDWLLKQKRP